MRTTARTVALGLLVAAQLPASELVLPDDPLAGRALFESKNCNRCHGLSGIRPGIAFDLGEGHFSGSLLDLGAGLWNHVPSMSVTFEVTGLTWPVLSEAEAVGLLSFLYFIDYLGHPGVASAGEGIFEARGCSECHTVDGSGSAIGPDLSDFTGYASPLAVAQAIWNHGPSMLESMRQLGMKPPEFAAGDLEDLAAFLRQKAPLGPRERELLNPGNPNRGDELFRSKGCASCHGGNGRGGDLGPDLTAADLHRSAASIAGSMWNHALGMRDSMRQRGLGWPELSTTELADLVAFLYFLPFSDSTGDADQGAELFATRSCGGCHGGGDGRQAPDLSGSSATRSAAALVAAMWSHAPFMKEAILSEGRPWPDLSGDDLRDLLAYLGRVAKAP